MPLVQLPKVLLSIDGIAIEGGYDGLGRPATCWGPAIALAMCAPHDQSVAVWADLDSLIDAAAEVGLQGVRLTVEWARLEPHQGERDESAMERYVRAVDRAVQRGLAVVVCVVDQAWPAWLGQEAWQLPWTQTLLVEHARWIGESFTQADRLQLFARPDALVEGGWRLATAPPWRRGEHEDAHVVETRLAASRLEVAELSSWRNRSIDTLPEFPLLTNAGAMRGVLRAATTSTAVVRSLVGSDGPLGPRDGVLESAVSGWRLRVGRDVLGELL